VVGGTRVNDRDVGEELFHGVKGFTLVSVK